MNETVGSLSGLAIPFDPDRLDKLMDDAGLDVLLVSSKHNVQYMLGGYRFFMFDYSDAFGLSRYLPLFVYPKGRPAESAYIAYRTESYEQELGKFWAPTVKMGSRGTLDAAAMAVEHIEALQPSPRRIGVEAGFLPADAFLTVQEAMPDVELVDAVYTLERLRARKTADELAKLRTASECVAEAMQAVFAGLTPRQTKREVVQSLRNEETARGLTYEFCLITAGASLNRAPSDQALKEGDIVSLDSGGSYQGYLGDICRMGIVGEPDRELADLLAEVDGIQQAARRPIRAGALGSEIYAAVDPLVNRVKVGKLNFVAHGMGLITHEAPRLAASTAGERATSDLDQPLEPGMVVSIETALHHPKRGFIKLEDTVAVTESGCEAYGDRGRGWNRAGAAA
jgi:Xaa-Pro aminopeptidase